MILSDEFIDIPKAIQSFKNDTGFMLLLRKEEINVLKSQLTDNYKNMNLLELINQLNDALYELEVKSSDIKYKYKNKNKTEEREEQIIVFGTKETIQNLSDEKNKEYFIDNKHI